MTTHLRNTSVSIGARSLTDGPSSPAIRRKRSIRRMADVIGFNANSCSVDVLRSPPSAGEVSIAAVSSFATSSGRHPWSMAIGRVSERGRSPSSFELLPVGAVNKIKEHTGPNWSHPLGSFMSSSKTLATDRVDLSTLSDFSKFDLKCAVNGLKQVAEGLRHFLASFESVRLNRTADCLFPGLAAFLGNRRDAEHIHLASFHLQPLTMQRNAHHDIHY
jgi:hypothetical protein